MNVALNRIKHFSQHPLYHTFSLISLKYEDAQTHELYEIE
jgi:hypothetical protein